MLFDAKDPTKVLDRTDEPFFSPELLLRKVEIASGLLEDINPDIFVVEWKFAAFRTSPQRASKIQGYVAKRVEEALSLCYFFLYFAASLNISGLRWQYPPGVLSK